MPPAQCSGDQDCRSSGSVPGDGTEAAHPPVSTTVPSAQALPGPGLRLPVPALSRGASRPASPPWRTLSIRPPAASCRLISSKAHKADDQASAPQKPVPRLSHCHTTGLSPKSRVRKTHSPQNQLLGLRAVLQLGRHRAGGSCQGPHRDLRPGLRTLPRCPYLPVLSPSAQF